MKKLYIQPETIVCEAMPAQMLAASGASGTLDGGTTPIIDFGGTDEGGTQDPSVKGDWGDIWD